MLLTFQDGKFIFDNDEVNFTSAMLLRQHADKKAARIISRALVKRYTPTLSEPLPAFLDAHQKAGVMWTLTRSRSYLAHAPGAGKTAEAITAAILSRSGGKVVFIVPPSLTVNWGREIMKFYGLITPDLSAWPKIAILPPTAKEYNAGWRADFIIVPDSMLAKDWVLSGLLNLNIGFLAVDEASRFKESTSERTKALFGGKLKNGNHSPGLIYSPKHTVLMDGSPMPNRPIELWAPTYAMAPHCIDFMSKENFGFHFCGAQMNRFGQWEFRHASNTQELRERLQKDFMHVVTEEELNHPERRRSLLFMSSDVRSAEHKKWERTVTPATFEKLLGEESSQGDLARFRAELGLRKVPWIAQYVTERLTTKNESILLFAWHREVCLKLAELLKAFQPVLVMGGTNTREREKGFFAFQNGQRKLIIGNIAAMGRGHNLQNADRVIFGEYSWCDETNLQCEKRASRRGSKKAFTRCEYIVSGGSIDEIVLNSVFRKAQTVRKVIG